MLGHSDERSGIPLAEQRQAFSSLRAIKAGRRVTSVRTGHRVREYLPGTVPQQNISSQQNTAARFNSRIQIYQVTITHCQRNFQKRSRFFIPRNIQDEQASGDEKPASILDHIAVEETIHKENSIKPGPWNNMSKKYPLMPSTIKPAFKGKSSLIN